MTQSLSPCAEIVRQEDHDRFLTALFAPDTGREDLFALYAFNFEIAATREKVSEAMIGEIRLQWWRDAIGEIYNGRPRDHPVVAALAQAVARHGLSRDLFDRSIDARSADFAEAPPENLAELRHYAIETSATVMQLALEVLGARNDQSDLAAHEAGIAWALAGLVRAAPVHGRQGRMHLPRDVLDAASVDPHAAMQWRDADAMRAVVRGLVDAATEHAAEARRLARAAPRHALPALLPLSLASLYLTRLRRNGGDVTDTGLNIGGFRRQLYLTWRVMLRRP